MKRKRPLTESELDLWRRATADVRPLADIPKNDVPSEPSPQSEPVEVNTRRKTVNTPRTNKQSQKPPAAAKAFNPSGPVDIDRRSWTRLRRGQIEIERTLDLHGRTQTEAHGALNRFLTMASAAGLRCVLVVTGKGRSEGRGVLRQLVPRWLDEAPHRQSVLTYCPAQPRHGGDGAIYVLLRRQRRGGER